MKVFRRSVERDWRDTELEQARLWRRYPHPNLIRILHAVVGSNGPMALVFPFCRETLQRRFEHYCGIFPLSTSHTLMEHLALGLNHMHMHGVLHRDVKPSNCLLHSSTLTPVILVICDFGWCKSVGVGHSTETPGAQTPMYRAPEVELGLTYGPSADTWAVGVMYRELLTGVQLWRIFRGDTALQYAERIVGAIDSDLVFLRPLCQRVDPEPWRPSRPRVPCRLSVGRTACAAFQSQA